MHAMQSFHVFYFVLSLSMLYLTDAIQTQERCSDPKPRSVSCTAFAHNISMLTTLDEDHRRASSISDARMTRLRWLNPDNCYVLVEKPMTYKNAQDVCRQANGTLALAKSSRVVDDLVKHAILENVLKKKRIPLDENPGTSTFPELLGTIEGEGSSKTTTVEENSAKEGLWVGVTIAEHNDTVHDYDCYEPESKRQDLDLSKYCMGGRPEENKSAALCQGMIHQGSAVKSCLCWRDNTDELPFYCETSLPCLGDPRLVYEYLPKPLTCSAFHAFLVRDDYTHLLPMEDTTWENGLSNNSCYILFDYSADWRHANMECERAGGRVAWLKDDKHNKGAKILLDFAIERNVIDQQNSSLWIGLERWELGLENETRLWEVKRWSCPSHKSGKNHQFFEKNDELEAEMMQSGQRLDTWNFATSDPIDEQLRFAYIQKTSNNKDPSTVHIRFDKSVKTKRKYFCEITLAVPEVPETPEPTDKKRQNIGDAQKPDEDNEQETIAVILGSSFIGIMCAGFLVMVSYYYKRRKTAQKSISASLAEQGSSKSAESEGSSKSAELEGETQATPLPAVNAAPLDQVAPQCDQAPVKDAIVPESVEDQGNDLEVGHEQGSTESSESSTDVSSTEYDDQE